MAGPVEGKIAGATSPSLVSVLSHDIRHNLETSTSRPKRRFKSYRLQGDYERPWLSDPKLNKTKWNAWVMTGFVVLGFVAAGAYCFLEVRNSIGMPVRTISMLPPNDTHQTDCSCYLNQLCLILEDDFKTLNTDIWSHEVQVGPP